MLATLTAEPEVCIHTAADQTFVGTRETLLNKLGLDGDELQDLLVKFTKFQRDLSPNQVEVLVRSLPSLERASRTLGTTVDNLAALFREESDNSVNVVICGFEGMDRP